MDLIYIILSVFLRLSPAVRKLSSVSSGARNRRHDLLGLAFWVPMVGWVSVSVQHRPDAKWFVWRVREVNAFHFSASLNSNQEQGWRVDFGRRGQKPHPRRRSPDTSSDAKRNAK